MSFGVDGKWTFTPRLMLRFVEMNLKKKEGAFANSNPTALSIADGCLGRDQKGKRAGVGVGGPFSFASSLSG